MKPYPLSIQLYTVRDQVKGDFPAVLKRVADIGYAGVEFAGLHGISPAELRKIVDDLGLKVSSTHGPFPSSDNVNEIVDTAKTLGYTRHIAGFGPADLETLEKTQACAERLAGATELLKGTGISFGLHNHWWEWDKQFDGKYPEDVLLDAAPDAFAEIDTYWVKVGGADPAAVVKRLGTRAPVLHIKDGPANREQAMTAVGSGVLDWNAIIGAAHPDTEWLIVELDRCDTDMWQAVVGSHRYLTGNGFAKGR